MGILTVPVKMWKDLNVLNLINHFNTTICMDFNVFMKFPVRFTDLCHSVVHKLIYQLCQFTYLINPCLHLFVVCCQRLSLLYFYCCKMILYYCSIVHVFLLCPSRGPFYEIKLSLSLSLSLSLTPSSSCAPPTPPPQRMSQCTHGGETTMVSWADQHQKQWPMAVQKGVQRKQRQSPTAAMYPPKSACSTMQHR